MSLNNARSANDIEISPSNRELNELPLPTNKMPEPEKVPVPRPPLQVSGESKIGILNRLLLMADNYLQARSFKQAEEIYFDLLFNYRDTDQGKQAYARLLQLCDLYGQEGKAHQVRGILERLYEI